MILNGNFGFVARANLILFGRTGSGATWGYMGLHADVELQLPNLHTRVRGVLKKIRTPHDPDVFGTGGTNFRAQSISDAVAFSTLPTIEGLSVLVGKLREFSVALLYQGFFTRGAVCKGLLHHDDQMVFGEALIRAHTLESTVVKYPRIMITKDVVDDALHSDKSKEFSEFIIPAEDGPSYLHVLWQLGMILEIYNENPAHQGSEHFLNYYSAIQAMIERRFSESVDTPKHFEKVKWFANYWNETVDPIGGRIIMHINGSGLSWHVPPPVDNRIA
jgi:hypothetical protein